ncbi:MAG: hypothetical protein RI897_4324 [Verrucomicrobiota bacterium]
MWGGPAEAGEVPEVIRDDFGGDAAGYGGDEESAFFWVVDVGGGDEAELAAVGTPFELAEFAWGFDGGCDGLGLGVVDVDFLAHEGVIDTWGGGKADGEQLSIGAPFHGVGRAGEV